MKFNKKNLLVSFCILIFFLENIKIGGDFGFDFRINFLFFIPLSILLLILNPKLYYYKSLGGFFFLIFLFNIYQYFICHNSFEIILKYNILFVINIVFSYSILNYTNFEVNKIVGIYYRLSFILCVIGLIQFASFFINFKYGYDFSYLGLNMGNVHPDFKRIQSIFEEPSFFAYSICLAFFISLSKFFNIIKNDKKLYSIVIILAMILTFSTIAYIIIILSTIIILFSKYKVFKKPIHMVFFGFILFLFGLFSFSNEYINKRVIDSYKIYVNLAPTYEDVSKINLSTYAFYSNYKIMIASLSEHSIIGYGFFNYKKSYYENFNYIPDNMYKYVYRLNDSDGNSLFIRLCVELGVVFLIIFILLIIKNRIRFSSSFSSTNSFLWVVNNGVFILMLVRLLRQGHYTNCAFLFFIMLYFYSYKKLGHE